VDDDESFQTFVSRPLRAAGYVVRSYPSASAFLSAKIEESPACILLDVRLPGPSGLDLQQTLAARPDPLPIIFVSGSSDIQTSVQAMKAGAVDFLTKPVAHQTLLKAVRSALALGEQDHIARRHLSNSRARYQTLTNREQEVFRCVVAGRTNREIAAELGCALRTVKAHRARAMQKMHATSVADLVHIANQLQETKAPSQIPTRPA